MLSFFELIKKLRVCYYYMDGTKGKSGIVSKENLNLSYIFIVFINEKQKACIHTDNTLNRTTKLKIYFE